MAKIRREFAPEFKRETVALLESSGRPLSQVAIAIGIARRCYAWREVVHGGVARSRTAQPNGAAPALLADQQPIFRA